MTIVLFDYGGVLGDHHIAEAEAELGGFLSVDVPTVRALLSEKSEQGLLIREGRLAEVEFWSRVSALAGLSNLPASPSVLTNAWCRTYRPNVALFNILTQLRPAATTGVVTNIDPWRSKYLLDTVHIMDWVDHYYPSFEFGITKRHPQFWPTLRNHIEAELGQSRMMYVDDRTEHVNSAVNAGFSGYLYDGGVDKLAQALSSWIQLGRAEGIS